MSTPHGKTPRITAVQAYDRPPQWAVLERQLIERMDGAAEAVL